MRRLLDHRRAVFLRCVSRSYQGADLNSADAHRLEILLNAAQWFLQVDLNIVAQRFQWRDINDLRFIDQFSVHSFPNQIVDGGKKGGERFARTGGRGNQRVLATFDGGPGAGLWFSRSRKPFQEPVADRGMEIFELFHIRTASVP